MKIDKAGLDLIKHFEGFSLRSYKCPAGVWTIGYGTTGQWVKEGVIITAEMADQLLRDDVAKFERGVERALQGAPTTQNQFSAMVSLAYNIGLGGFQRSSVLRHHRAVNKLRAAASFLMWVKGGGKTLPGLVRRRNAERKLYLS